MSLPRTVDGRLSRDLSGEDTAFVELVDGGRLVLADNSIRSIPNTPLVCGGFSGNRGTHCKLYQEKDGWRLFAVEKKQVVKNA